MKPPMINQTTPSHLNTFDGLDLAAAVAIHHTIDTSIAFARRSLRTRRLPDVLV